MIEVRLGLAEGTNASDLPCAAYYLIIIQGGQTILQKGSLLGAQTSITDARKAAEKELNSLLPSHSYVRDTHADQLATKELEKWGVTVKPPIKTVTVSAADDIPWNDDDF